MKSFLGIAAFALIVALIFNVLPSIPKSVQAGECICSHELFYVTFEYVGTAITTSYHGVYSIEHIGQDTYRLSICEKLNNCNTYTTIITGRFIRKNPDW